MARKVRIRQMRETQPRAAKKRPAPRRHAAGTRPAGIVNWQQTLGNRRMARILEKRAGESHPDAHQPDDENRLAQSGNPEAESGDLQAGRFKGDAVLEAVHDGNRLIRTGSRGEPVRKIQQGLLDAGYTLPNAGADSIFGAETRAAVVAFQHDRGLQQDGIIGPNTMGALDDHHAGGGGGGGGGGGTKPKPKPKPKPKQPEPKATLNVKGDDAYVDNVTESRKNVSFNVNWSGGAQEDFVVVNWLKGYMKRSDGKPFKVQMYGNTVDFNFGDWQVDSVDKDPVYWSDDKKRWNYIVDGANKFHATDSPGPMFTSDGKGAEAKVDFKVAVYKSSDVAKTTTGQLAATPIHTFQTWTYHVRVLGAGKYKHSL